MRQEISFGKLKLTNNKGANNNNTQVILGFFTELVQKVLEEDYSIQWILEMDLQTIVSEFSGALSSVPNLH